MANTFELIASSTVGSGGASSIDFTSIPSTYTDLCLVTSLRTSGTSVGNAYGTFNGSTSGYSNRVLQGTGSGVSSFSGLSTAFYAGIFNTGTQTSNTFASTQIYIPNYAGSNNKSISTDNVTENNATEAYARLIASLWSNSAAITSISLFPESSVPYGTFVQYSTAYLYGVKNA